MNTKNILIFSAGVVVGAVIGTLVTKNRYERMYEEIVEEEVAPVRERTPRPRNHHNGYSKIIKTYGGDVEAAEAMADPAELEHPLDEGEEYDRCEQLSNNGNMFNPPYIVSADQHYDENPHFDKITVCYYEGDSTLADESEEIIQDVDGTIGENALVSFGHMSGDPNVVYVRNERLSIDYEVIRLSKKYSDTL